MRIKPLVVLSLVCSLSHAADTVASLGDSIKATQFVTEVDHTKLVNGTTEVIANANGTASIVTPGAEKWVITPSQGSADRRYTATGGYEGYYSGANSDALLYRLTFYDDPTSIQTGDTTIADVEFLRREDSGVTNLLWKAPIRFLSCDLGTVMKLQGDGIMRGFSPDRYASSGSTVDGTPTDHDFSTMTVGGEVTYLIVSEDSFVYFQFADPIDWQSFQVEHTYDRFSKTVATVDQFSEFVDKSVTNGLASTSFVNNALSGKMNTVACIAEGDVAVIMPDGNAHDSGSHINSFSQTNHVHYSITTDEPGLIGGDGATLEIHNNGTATVTWHPGSAPPTPGEPAPKSWTKVLAFTNDIQTVPNNVSAFNNDAGYVKTNAQGTLVVGSNQMQPNGGSWSLVMGSGGSHSKSDNTLILSPGSNIGTNAQYSAVFGPGAYIHDNAQYSFAFGGGINIQDNCNDSFVVGSGAQSAHKCAFLWSANSNGGETIPAQPITHGNGTFNINTYDGVAGVYIGNTNLQQIIRLEAKAMIHDAVSQVNVNLQSAEDTRAALTNLITILKNL